MDLHLNYPFNFFGMGCQVVAGMANKKINVKIIDAETIKSADYKSQNMTGKFPMLKTSEGCVNESCAIAKFLAHGTPLLGSNATERAQIDQWMYWGTCTALPGQFPALMAAHGHAAQTKDAYNKSIADTKANIKSMNAALGDNQWIAGDKTSVADIMLAAFFTMAVGSFLDAGFRKAMPKWAAWYERVSKLPAWIAVFGHVKPCLKGVTPKFTEEAKPVKKADAPKAA